MERNAHLDEAAIGDWLREHPDFLRQHPELLAALELSHDTGAASLIELQVRRLREENAQLREQLRRLIAIAADNERLMQRLHRLTLDLMNAGDAAVFIDHLNQHLKADFKARLVLLHLPESAASLVTHDGMRALPASLPEWLQQLMQSGKPLCGRLTRSKLETVFGEHARTVASAALAPLPDGGLLAIGADDAERFYPDMGTLFLELLAGTVSFRLAQFGSRQRKRA